MKLQLFLVSFAILYLELTLIRLIPAYIRYLGYFTNFILLGAFLGIGLGCLIARRRYKIFSLTPVLLFILIVVIYFFRFEVGIVSNQVLYLQSNTETSPIQTTVLLPGVFLLVALIFTSLSQRLGELLSKFKPLTAYTIDILGSIAGIIIFTVGSFLGLPPSVWITIFFLIYISLSLSNRSRWVSVWVWLVILFVLPKLDTLPVYWSPYQKVSPYSVSNPKNELGKPFDHWRLYVNNISHQEMTPLSGVGSFYLLPFQAYPNRKYQDVLIIGSGSGQDVNVALSRGAEIVDAVEIDPVIARMGKELHPDKPYSDAKVNLIINDARTYLENTDKKYDLIIFALPDSTVLSTSLSNLRLESYLFTEEAFREAKEHLKSDGVFSLYNYYRTQWLIDKIGQMLTDVFGYAPFIVHYESNLAVFAIEAQGVLGSTPFSQWQGKEATQVVTDDWPFLYLRQASIPNIYIKALLIIGAIAFGLTFLAARGQILKNFSFDFFFLGAAFLLIETKSIVNFNLLFGATWLVNSLVFIGILISVLIAIWINQVWQIKRLGIIMLLLFIVLFLNYVVPLKSLLVSHFGLRFFLAALFLFTPITLANVIFTSLFKDTKEPANAFGVNILGAFVGGCLEYLSLLLGYRNLILVAIVMYACAFIFVLKRRKSSGLIS